jgi:hypothetical protein
MTNEGKNFQVLYEAYASMGKVFEDANNGRITMGRARSKPIKSLTALAVTAIDEKLNLPDDKKLVNKPEIIAGIQNGGENEFYQKIFEKAVPYQREKANKYAKDNLEGVLENLGDVLGEKHELYTAFLLKEKINPKSSFEGDNKEVYEKISKKHRKFKMLASVADGEDDAVKTEVVQKSYESDYDANDANEKEAMELCQDLAGSNQTVRDFKLGLLLKKGYEDFNDSIKDHKPGYIAGHLADIPFVDFLESTTMEFNDYLKQLDFEARKASQRKATRQI